MASVVRLPVRGPFSLDAATAFLGGFGAAMTSAAGPAPDGSTRLCLAFPVEGDWRSAAAVVRQEGPSIAATELVVEVTGPMDPQRVAAQVGRILSVDVDGDGFVEVARRDPVLARLQRHHPGLRPVCFWSAYESACWAVIGQRISMRQAARIKGSMAEQLGERLEAGGIALVAFPSPQRLVDLEAFPGLPDRKAEWLRGLARAALEGRLDAATLRALPRPDALAQLRALDGIGDFSAELILLRGCGDPDAFPTREPRLLDAMRQAYGRPTAGNEELARVAEAWRPYRTWAAVLFRAEAGR